MVGVPRSSGCQLCRKRRVKCDEARPACGNCIKYGTECPGYDRRLKFVVGKHQIRQRGKEKVDDAHGRDASSSSSSSESLSYERTLTFRSSPVRVTVTAAPRLRPPLTPPIYQPLQPMRGHVIYQMVENFCPSAPPDVIGLMKWVGPDSMGTQALLDGALCSLSLHLTGKETSNSQLVAQSRTVYGKSLNALQAALRHPWRWRSSETLFAAILLCYFELFAGTSSPDTWLQHAKGIGILMERRGPAAHAEGWDAAMLLSFRGILMMSDMFFPGETDGFLSRPEWRPIMCDRGRCLVHPPGTPAETILVADGFFQRLVDVPSVLKWGYMVREANKVGIPVEPAQLAILAHVAGTNQASFKRWYDEEFTALPYVQHTEIAATNPATAQLYPTIFEYQSPWAGAMHLGYWASMLILQETMAQCGAPVPDSHSEQCSLASNILRSVDCVGKGTMGPYRVGFSLRIAYEFASAEAQVWIRGMLDQFSKTYAATSKSVYPEPRRDLEGYT